MGASSSSPSRRPHRRGLEPDPQLSFLGPKHNNPNSNEPNEVPKVNSNPKVHPKSSSIQRGRFTSLCKRCERWFDPQESDPCLLHPDQPKRIYTWEGYNSKNEIFQYPCCGFSFKANARTDRESLIKFIVREHPIVPNSFPIQGCHEFGPHTTRLAPHELEALGLNTRQSHFELQLLEPETSEGPIEEKISPPNEMDNNRKD